ncbi:MAG: hypothetical protein M0008_01010, partial [Actinomycetota bacterium]|nr:hypothetical protein [Actinomycetota bacterium]
QPSLHRHPPVVRLRHRRRRNAFDETARETRRNPMALAWEEVKAAQRPGTQLVPSAFRGQSLRWKCPYARSALCDLE